MASVIEKQLGVAFRAGQDDGYYRGKRDGYFEAKTLFDQQTDHLRKQIDYLVKQLSSIEALTPRIYIAHNGTLEEKE